MNISNYLRGCQRRVNLVLKKRLPSPNKQPYLLHKAMRYTVLNGGKRIRSSIIYAVGESLGAKNVILNDVAAAIEIIHAYTLIHDDMPALDNDDLRHGKPTCHKIFGEGTALLAGDALQSLGFEIISNLDSRYISITSKLKMINLLAHAIGSDGVIGGQELDIKMTSGNVTLKKLETMYKLKTSCLLAASALFGALAANCYNKKILDNLFKFSERIGLAFQIHDDIIGMVSDTKILGKKQGSDQEKNKPVYPVFVGMDKAKQRENELYQQAIYYLNQTGLKSENLKSIAAYIIQRNY